MRKIIIICIAVIMLLAETAYGSIKDISDIFQNQIQSITERQEEKELEDFVTDDFVVYGIIDSELAPVVDFLSLLEENGIYIKLPELSVNNKDEYDWYSFKIGDSFWLYYVEYKNSSKISFTLEVPNNYKPKDDAFVLMIVSMLSLSKDEADKIYSSLEYNLIDEESSIETDNYSIWLTKNNWFQSLNIVLNPSDGKAEITDFNTNTEDDNSEIDYIALFQKQSELEDKIETIVNGRLSEYWEVELDKLTVLLEDDESIENINIFFTWNVENGAEKTKEMLRMYSDDIVAYVREQYQDMSFGEIWVLWEVPYLYKSGYAAKYKYTSIGKKMYFSDAYGHLYGKY